MAAQPTGALSGVQVWVRVCDTPLLIGARKGRRVSKIGVSTHIRTLEPRRDRRPGHSPDRTLRGADRPHHSLAGLDPVRAWAAARGHRRRTGVPGGGAGAVAL